MIVVVAGQQIGRGGAEGTPADRDHGEERTDGDGGVLEPARRGERVADRVRLAEDAAEHQVGAVERDHAGLEQAHLGAAALLHGGQQRDHGDEETGGEVERDEDDVGGTLVGGHGEQHVHGDAEPEHAHVRRDHDAQQCVEVVFVAVGATHPVLVPAVRKVHQHQQLHQDEERGADHREPAEEVHEEGVRQTEGDHHQHQVDAQFEWPPAVLQRQSRIAARADTHREKRHHHVEQEQAQCDAQSGQCSCACTIVDTVV
mmetsp:Transcript_3535/g.8514  ORF Transcript_3535/g.8514 Transcript_3535/m.8514 type:complete len:258 (-) Transcript_3535:277-1050(-)